MNGKVLILHAGALGDAVLTLGVARGLGWSGGGVNSVATGGGESVAMAGRSGVVRWGQRYGVVGAAYSLEALGLHALYGGPREVPGHVTDFLGSFSRIISFLGGPGEAVSGKLAERFGDAVVAIDPRPTAATLQRGWHITAQWADQLSRHGIEIDVPLDEGLTLRENERAECRDRLRRKVGTADDRAIVLCHPGSGGLEKCVPPALLEALVRRLDQTGSWRTAWMIGPDERERFGAKLTERLAQSGPVVYEEDVEIAADLVCGADVFIGHDAGMTHLASFAGVRTVAIYGPTDPRVWGPVGPKRTIVGFPRAGAGGQRWGEELCGLLMEGQSGRGFA